LRFYLLELHEKVGDLTKKKAGAEDGRIPQTYDALGVASAERWCSATAEHTIPPHQIIASAYVLSIGAGRNPGCLTSKKVPFKLAESLCQGRTRAESLREPSMYTLGLSSARRLKIPSKVLEPLTNRASSKTEAASNHLLLESHA
jgi:hypothetical protein